MSNIVITKIQKNLELIREQMQRACSNSKRSLNSVQLVAVSKTKPASMVLEAYEAGQKIFGENYVQEALAKKNEIHKLLGNNDQIEWHFIGHLQSNKVQNVVGEFELIHSVDRLSLLQAIEKACEKKIIQQKILLEINLADEQSKSGASVDQIKDLVASLKNFKHIECCGLMCLPPLVEDESLQLQNFLKMKELLNLYKNQIEENQSEKFEILSMGTTHDYPAAIAAGATHIRVGTAIFGARE